LVRRVATVGFAILLALVFASGEARAGDDMRVCVLKISGADRQLKSEIVRLIDQPYSMLRASSFFKAVKRLRFGRRLSSAKVRRLAKYLNLGAIVTGKVIREKRGRFLVLKIRDGASGRVSETVRHRLRGDELGSGATRLRRELIGALERVRIGDVEVEEVARVQESEEAEEAEESEEAESEDDWGDEDGDWDELGDDGWDDDGDIDEGGDINDGDADEGDDTNAIDEGDADAGEIRREKSSLVDDRGGSGPNVAVDGGLGAQFRNLRFVSDPSLTGTEVPIDYQGGLVPAAFVGLEVYPMAIAGKGGKLADLGIDANFEQALTISTIIDPDGGSADNAFDVSTSYRRFGAGVRYRLAVNRVRLAVRAGLGRSAFTLDKAAAMGPVDLPNTTYTFFDPGVTAELPIGQLSIDAGVRYLVVLGAGEIVDAASYGRAGISAFDAAGGITYAVRPNIGVRLGFRVTRVKLDFAGGGMLSDRNGDDDNDVMSARDLYAGGLLTGSYQF
jgi:hypothetical protein